jgi:hypothetical protein
MTILKKKIEFIKQKRETKDIEEQLYKKRRRF